MPKADEMATHLNEVLVLDSQVWRKLAEFPHSIRDLIALHIYKTEQTSQALHPFVETGPLDILDFVLPSPETMENIVRVVSGWLPLSHSQFSTLIASGRAIGHSGKVRNLGNMPAIIDGHVEFIAHGLTDTDDLAAFIHDKLTDMLKRINQVLLLAKYEHNSTKDDLMVLEAQGRLSDLMRLAHNPRYVRIHDLEAKLINLDKFQTGCWAAHFGVEHIRNNVTVMIDHNQRLANYSKALRTANSRNTGWWQQAPYMRKSDLGAILQQMKLSTENLKAVNKRPRFNFHQEPTVTATPIRAIPPADDGKRAKHT